MYLRLAAFLLVAACLLGLGLPGCDDNASAPLGPPEPAPITSPAGLVTALASALDAEDCARASALLAHVPDANAMYRFVRSCPPIEPDATSWGYAEETVLLCRLFDPEVGLPGVAPLPPELWLEALTLTLTPEEPFSERPDLYSSNDGADGRLDPRRWRAMDAHYTTDLFFELAGTDYKVEGGANLVVVEDLAKNRTEDGRFLLLEWEDLCTSPVSVAGRAFTLGEVKSMYRARHRPETVLEAVAGAYVRRDPDLFESILAHESSAQASFTFMLASPSDRGETQWGRAEELRIHQRMFHPDRPFPGEPAVAPELWLRSVQVWLWKSTAFEERPDFYSAVGGADGKLDPVRWRALGARYETYVFFDLEGPASYKVEGTADFVVIEDRLKDSGEVGKYLLYGWDDRAVVEPAHASLDDPAPSGTNQVTWTNLKTLYR